MDHSFVTTHSNVRKKVSATLYVVFVFESNKLIVVLPNFAYIALRSSYDIPNCWLPVATQSTFISVCDKVVVKIDEGATNARSGKEVDAVVNIITVNVMVIVI